MTHYIAHFKIYISQLKAAISEPANQALGTGLTSFTTLTIADLNEWIQLTIGLATLVIMIERRFAKRKEEKKAKP